MINNDDKTTDDKFSVKLSFKLDEKYRDVQCNLCLHKFIRSMEFNSWEGWGCASEYDIERQKIYSRFGSKYDTNIIKIYNDKFLTYWDNIDINKRFIICDECIEEGIKNKIMVKIGNYM
jgi:hypothetical protein